MAEEKIINGLEKLLAEVVELTDSARDEIVSLVDTATEITQSNTTEQPYKPAVLPKPPSRLGTVVWLVYVCGVFSVVFSVALMIIS